MRILLLFLPFIIFMSCASNDANTPQESIPLQVQPKKGAPTIYVFSKTNGFRHDNIDLGRGIMMKTAGEQGWDISFTEDSLLMSQARLGLVDVLVFFNTTGDVLGAAQEKFVEEFVKKGGGFLGIHAAADTEYDWPFYHELVGGYFNGHPSDPDVRKATCRATDLKNPILKDLPKDWTRNDEWYNYRDLKEHIQPLYMLDESTYEGGNQGDNHPIAWCHEKFAGRVVYTGMGHTKESFAEPEFKQFLVQAIDWILVGKG